MTKRLLSRFSPLCLGMLVWVGLTACSKPAPSEGKDAAASSVVASANTAANQAGQPVDLTQQTEAYKTWVTGQIDLLLADTEKFVARAHPKTAFFENGGHLITGHGDAVSVKIKEFIGQTE